MAELSPIPKSYQEWRQMITGRCGLTLTHFFVESRLKELGDSDHPSTRQFQEKFGEEYLRVVIGWYETAQREAV